MERKAKREPERRSLTQLYVERLKYRPAAPIVWDRNLPGFGVRVSPTGRKSWIVTYRVGGKGPVIWETLGNSFVLPSVADARSRARASQDVARSGIHPVKERKRTEQEREAAAAAAKEAMQREIDHKFDTVAKRYLAEAPRPARAGRKGYDGEIRRNFERYLIPRWGDASISSISQQDVKRLIKEKAEKRERPFKGRTDGATNVCRVQVLTPDASVRNRKLPASTSAEWPGQVPAVARRLAKALVCPGRRSPTGIPVSPLSPMRDDLSRVTYGKKSPFVIVLPQLSLGGLQHPTRGSNQGSPTSKT